MNNIYDLIRSIVVRVSTPFSSGSGFYIGKQRLFVTNYHIIKGCREVVLKSSNLKRSVAKVVYKDPVYDIAFLMTGIIPGIQADVKLSGKKVSEGEEVIVAGHPLGFDFSFTKGIISHSSRDFDRMKYYQVDAAINPGNSGGPLADISGEIIGMNTFIIKHAQSMAFSIPIRYIKESIDEFYNLGCKPALRCTGCRKVVLLAKIKDGFCNYCGYKFPEKDHKPDDFKPAGIAAKIEKAVAKAGYNVTLSRSGGFRWELEKNNTKAAMFFNQKSGFLIADSFICFTPQNNIVLFFRYLLEENNHILPFYFYIRKNEIFLSFVMHHDDIFVDIASQMIRDLMNKSIEYRKNLQVKFGTILHLNF